jgi:hypothetical protein
MAAPIASRLILNTKNFTRGLSTATKGIGVLGGAIGKVAGIVAKFAAVLGVATAGLTAIVLRSAAYIDRLGKVSKVTGVAVDTLQKFGFAAEQAGVTSDNAALALRRFSRRLGEAQKNTGELLPALRRLGIDTKDSEGNFKSAEQVLFEFADGIANTEDASQRLALAFKAFDSEGAELVETLMKGSDGLKEMFDRAQALGFVLDQETIAGVETFNDKLNELRRTIGGLVNRMVGALAPALTEISDALLEQILQLKEELGGWEQLGDFLKDKFLTIMQELGRIFFNLYAILVKLFNLIITALGEIGAAGDIANLKGEIADLREEANKPFLMRFNVAGGKAEEILKKEFGSFFTLTDENITRAIEVLEKGIEDARAAGGLEISPIAEPDQSLFQQYFDFLEQFKTKAQEAQTEIEEVVVTGARVQMGFFEKMLDKVFGKKKMDDFFASAEEYAEKATINVADFIKITFTMMGESIGEFFKNIREKLAASGFGDAVKTLEDGFIKAGQLLEDSLTDAVLTGKASFSDLADHIKKVLAKALIQKFITGPLLGLIPGLASGGPAQAGQPYVVGEEGPELFVPRQSGTVVPNDEMTSGGAGVGMGTQVTYNINAIDSRSFESRLAQNPEFIYNLTTVGARRQPA